MVLFAVTVSLLIYDINALRSENILCNFNALKLAQTEGPTTHLVVGFPWALEGKAESAGARAAHCRCLLGQARKPGVFCDSVTAFVCWSQQLLEHWVAISWDRGLSASLCHSAFLFWLSLLESMLLSTHKFKIAVSFWKIELFNIIKWHIYTYICIYAHNMHIQYMSMVHIDVYILYMYIYNIYTIQYTHTTYMYIDCLKSHISLCGHPCLLALVTVWMFFPTRTHVRRWKQNHNLKDVLYLFV